MLVSIIVITYNSSKYVLDTLRSVIAQTYKNIELIVSDDCSSDNTLALCSNWIEEHKGRFFRAQITRTPQNLGICGNYNHARRLAQGDWIKYIAGDDMLKPDCVERFVANIQPDIDLYFSDAVRQKASASIANKESQTYQFDTEYQTITETSTSQDTTEPSSTRPEIWHSPLRNTDVKHQLGQMLRYHPMIPGPAIFVNRKALDEVNGFDERFPMSEDYPIVMRFLTHGKPVRIIEEPLVIWRTHSESVSVNYTTSGFSQSVKDSVLYYTKKYCPRFSLFGIHYHEWLTIWIREHQNTPLHHYLGYFLRCFDLINLKRKIFPAPKWVEIRH